MNPKLVVILLIFTLITTSVLADDQFKPYLHNPSVPQHPAVKLFGEYSTNLYSGIATYSYSIDTPKGVGGLQPKVGVYYNSEDMRSRPGILGAGWSINYNYIYRDINSTPDDTSDDFYVLMLDDNVYQLVYSNGAYHTKVDYYYLIQNISNYWVVTKQDGTQYRFGFTNDSLLNSNTGRSYSIKWALDLVTDTHGNTINYTYSQNPNPEDIGSQYLSSIIYNSDTLRKITFNYEPNARLDRRRIYSQGNLLEESRRLTDITISVNNQLVRKDHFDYKMIGPAFSSLSNIIHYGADNVSILYNISFDYYLPNTGYTNISSFIPPALFSDSSHNDFGVRLVDVNNDGFVDMVQRNGSISQVWINNGTNWVLNNNWVIPENITDSSGKDKGIRFEDINHDGLVDIVKSISGTNKTYLNNGTGWSLSNWIVPCDFVDSSSDDLGCNIIDVNGDGWPDLVKAFNGKRIVWLNNGSAWVLSNWTVPVDFINSAYSDNGSRFVDVNGDGLPDIVLSYNFSTASKQVYINNGTGWSPDSSWIIPVYFQNYQNYDNGVRFEDVNGDGLVDILNYVNNTGSTAWLNNGSGWVQNNSWNSTEPFIFGGLNIGRRLADIDGDGFSDIIVSHQNLTQAHVWIKTHTLPYMLKTIKNEYGGVIQLNYTASTQFDNTLNNISQLGFNIYVISSVLKNNSVQGTLNAIANVSYNYSGGKYNNANKEFRGFAMTSEFYPDSRIDHYFYQDDALKGKEYSTKIYNSTGSLYSRKDTGFNSTTFNGIYNVSILFSTDYLYDGNVIPVINNKSYFYNTYGNYQYIIDWGDINVTGDELYYNYSYALNMNPYIVNKVARETISDVTGKIKETKYYYDNKGLAGVSIGDLTKTEIWNSNGNNTFIYNDYDQFGNLISKTDSYGNTEKYSYDVTNTYPTSYVNALGQVIFYNYNITNGGLLYQEKDGIRTNYLYDTFGRILEEVQPYDSFDLPTKRYVYLFDGVAPENVIIKQRTSSDKTLDTSYFYDGFANLIQVKTKADNGLEIVKNIDYDVKFRPFMEQNPYYAAYSGNLTNVSATANYTTYTYDALDRIIKVTNPDGTQKNTVLNQRTISDYDENNHRHDYVLDGMGRIIHVIEYNLDPFLLTNQTYNTNYSYDGNNNLIKIVDDLGHTFQFNYDSLGRKIGMQDPDMGNWTYNYDLDNNLISQTDARGQTISLYYDALNRLISKNSTDINISFTYDTIYPGTLSSVSSNNITYTYNYDKRMRTISVTKNINGNIFTNNYLYDSTDRLISQNIQYKLDYIYNTIGKISYIYGFINNSNYNAFGSITNRTYNNGIIQTFQYDPQTNRLTNIATPYSPSIQNLSYVYDPVGNIMSINDTAYNKYYAMSYDSLDRLVKTAIGSDNYTYSYNSLGSLMKIVKNSQSKKYVYNNLAHAPSSIIDGSLGVDIYMPRDLNNGSKNRTFEFYILNDINTTISNVNLNIDFGDGHFYTATNIALNATNKFQVQNSYANGGDYVVKFNVSSIGIFDYEYKKIKFGIRAFNLSINNSNISIVTFRFDMGSDIVETIYNASYSCSDGTTSSPFTMAGNEKDSYYITVNYTTPGPKNFSCTARGADGNETATINFNVNGVNIENYDILSTNISRKVVTYNVKNYFNPVQTNISMAGDDTSSNIANLSSIDNIMVFAEFNYSGDAKKTLSIQANTNQSSSYYVDSFTYKGVTIKNYNRIVKNVTSDVLTFNVWNNWYPGLVNWSISDPVFSNSTYLGNNQSVAVFIESAYTTQGNHQPKINATIVTYIDKLNDFFEIRPIDLIGLYILKENITNSISELVIQNNLNSTQAVQWQYNTGQQNITNSTSVSPYSTIYVNISSNYSGPGIYQTNVSITTIGGAGYSDSGTGAITI